MVERKKERSDVRKYLFEQFDLRLIRDAKDDAALLILAGGKIRDGEQGPSDIAEQWNYVPRRSKVRTPMAEKAQKTRSDSKVHRSKIPQFQAVQKTGE